MLSVSVRQVGPVTLTVLTDRLIHGQWSWSASRTSGFRRFHARLQMAPREARDIIVHPNSVRQLYASTADFGVQSQEHGICSAYSTLVVLFTSIAPTSVWLLPRLTTDVTCIRHLSPKSEDSSASCASFLLFHPSRNAHVLPCNLLPMHKSRSYRLYRRRLSLYPENPFE